jgi:hypothetical protein
MERLKGGKDNMTAITDILKQVPIDQLAQQLGASKKDTKTASTQAITSLLAGLTSNATDSKGEEALAGALLQHLTSGQSFASAGVNLDDIDTKDGAEIVKHALGADPTKAAAAVAAKTGTDQSLLQKLLPILAPVVIAYLATQFFKGKTPTTTSDLGSVLGGLLGGGTQQASGGALSGILGGLLGEALGGDQTKTSQAQASSGGILGGLLDSIF